MKLTNEQTEMLLDKQIEIANEMNTKALRLRKLADEKRELLSKIDDIDTNIRRIERLRCRLVGQDEAISEILYKMKEGE